jgi:hypothetical protein
MVLNVEILLKYISGMTICPAQTTDIKLYDDVDFETEEPVLVVASYAKIRCQSKLSVFQGLSGVKLKFPR